MKSKLDQYLEAIDSRPTKERYKIHASLDEFIDAIIAGDLKGVQLILKQRKHLINLTTHGMRGWIALHYASQHGHTEIAKLLIDNGAQINKQKFDGYTPLMLAVLNEHPDMIKLLLEAGADINLKDNHSQTALRLATKREYRVGVKLLKEAGAKE